MENYFSKGSLKNIFFIILGTFFSSVGINLFIANANLLSGGVSGISLILEYLLKIPSGYFVFAFNIPLFVLSYRKMDRRFTIYSIIGATSLSIILILTVPMRGFIKINDPLLLCIYGGILNGLGVGMGFSNNGSGGGLDIVAAVIKKKHENFDIGNISFAVNCVIVTVGAFIFSIESALYTLVSMYITSFVIDKVIKGFNRDKLILIITEKEEEVSDWILRNLGRGVTFLYGEGAYTKNKRKILYCVVPLAEIPKIKNITKEIDNNAFISILDVSEVEGKGFKKRAK
ncbi:YitT family protein [uncultured Clostridium sp.]|uniref:YitT family protein n=1 Tax=uncultured Clostridium sp. TaxID=59620 RepID=UPI0028E76571|nr:YitT family protein [uncultured Clostridium sp.]